MRPSTRVRLQRLTALAIGALSWLDGSHVLGHGPALAAAQVAAARADAARANGKPRGKGAAAPHVRPVVEACVEHHTDAQELRMAGQLLESRAALRQCAAEACPALLQRDCVGWLDQLEPQIPSLTFRVTVDGQSRSDAQVFIDDEPTSDPALGKAVDVDPGQHRVRVLVPGLTPFEDQVLLSEGERYRMVEVALTSPPPPPPAPALPPPEMHRPIPVVSYVLGGVAVAGAVSGAIWSASSVALKSDLEKTCAPSCSQSRVNELRQRALLADASWGLSVLSLAGATAFYLLRPELPVTTDANVDVDIAIGPGGGMGVLRIDAF